MKRKHGNTYEIIAKNGKKEGKQLAKRGTISVRKRGRERLVVKKAGEGKK